MAIVLVFAVGLVAWALHLMQKAFDYREFSFMLAGTLVASAAAALVVVYFLMSSYVGYMTQPGRHVETVYPATVAAWQPISAEAPADRAEARSVRFRSFSR